jgi:hypothetical protein
MQRTINNGNSLTWENVAYNLEPVCRASIEYVDEVSRMPVVNEPGIGDYLATPTPEVPIIPTPTPVKIIYPTSTPFRTPTPYP